MAIIGTDILHAKALLEKGELVSIPTETVYGLGGNGFNPDAVTQIFKVKNRPDFDPLITHTNSLEKIKKYVNHIPDEAYQLADCFWPGPLTMLFSRNGKIPDLVSAGLPTVAVRIPHHELTLKLLESLDFPLAAPSANPFGYISPTTAEHVEDQLGEKIPYILDGGPCKIGIESTIIGFEEKIPIVYRIGGLPVEELEKVVGKMTILPNSSSNPKAPGMLKSHYAPTKPVIVGDLDFLIGKYDPDEIAILSFQEYFPQINNDHHLILSESGNVTEAAKNLFSSLRFLDTLPVKYILTELVPDHGLGRAINDRLRRAAAKW